MTLTVKTALESLMTFPKTTLISLVVHYRTPYVEKTGMIKQETLLSISQPEIAKYYYDNNWWNYVYEASKHYIRPDTPIYYIENKVDTGSKRRTVKIIINERNPLNKISFDLKNFEESYDEFNNFGGNGLTEINFIDKLAEIFTEYAIKTEVIRPSTVEYLTDKIYDILDDWRTSLIDYPRPTVKERYK